MNGDSGDFRLAGFTYYIRSPVSQLVSLLLIRSFSRKFEIISRPLRTRDLNMMSSETDRGMFLTLILTEFSLSGRFGFVKRTGIDLFLKGTPFVMSATLSSKLSRYMRHIPFTLCSPVICDASMTRPIASYSSGWRSHSSLVGFRSPNIKRSRRKTRGRNLGCFECPGFRP